MNIGTQGVKNCVLVSFHSNVGKSRRIVGKEGRDKEKGDEFFRFSRISVWYFDASVRTHGRLAVGKEQENSGAWPSIKLWRGGQLALD